MPSIQTEYDICYYMYECSLNFSDVTSVYLAIHIQGEDPICPTNTSELVAPLRGRENPNVIHLQICKLM